MEKVIKVITTPFLIFKKIITLYLQRSTLIKILFSTMTIICQEDCLFSCEIVTRSIKFFKQQSENISLIEIPFRQSIEACQW